MQDNSCAVCGEPIHFAHKIKGQQWVHSKPLGELKVSAAEVELVKHAMKERGHGPDRVYGGRIHVATPPAGVAIMREDY